MEKLRSLTPEHFAMLPEVTSYWTNVALDFSPGDRQCVVKAIRRLYAIGGFDEPTCIWLECPMTALLASVIFKDILSGIDVTGWEERQNRLHQGRKKPRSSIFPESGDFLISSHVTDAIIKYRLFRALRDKKLYSETMWNEMSEGLIDLEDVDWADNVKPMMDKMVEEINWAVAKALIVIGNRSGKSLSTFSYSDSDIDDELEKKFYLNSFPELVSEPTFNSIFHHVNDEIDRKTGFVSEIFDCSLKEVCRGLSAGHPVYTYDKQEKWPALAGSIRPLLGAPIHALEKILGVTTDNIYAEIDKNCGGYRMLEHVCFVSEKPTNIFFEKGLAVSINYASGWIADQKKEVSKFTSSTPNFLAQENRYESLERDPGMGNY